MVTILFAVISILVFRFRSRATLELKLVALQHQLAVLSRQRPGRFQLSSLDRLLWVLLYRIWPQVVDAMVLVKPATVMHRKEPHGTCRSIADVSAARSRRRAGGTSLWRRRTRLKAAGLDLQAPTRGDNGNAGNFQTPGTLVANAVQQDYFVKVTTKVVLPLFKERAKPFMLIFWSGRHPA